jgi:hypothetical protein
VPPEFDFTFSSHQAGKILLEVFEFREFLRGGSEAGLIAAGRHPKLKCLVGPLDVVTVSVLIEALCELVGTVARGHIVIESRDRLEAYATLRQLIVDDLKRQRAERFAFCALLSTRILKVLSWRYAGTCTKTGFSFFLLPRMK